MQKNLFNILNLLLILILGLLKLDISINKRSYKQNITYDKKILMLIFWKNSYHELKIANLKAQFKR